MNVPGAFDSAFLNSISILVRSASVSAGVMLLKTLSSSARPGETAARTIATITEPRMAGRMMDLLSIVNRVAMDVTWRGI